MSKQTLLAAAAGLASAVVFAMVLTGVPAAIMVAYFAQLPVLLVGLGLGLGHGLIATGSAMAAVVVAGGGLATAGLYFVVHALPMVILVRQALLFRAGPGQGVTWYPAGELLGILSGYAACAFLFAVVYFAGRDGGLMGVMTPVIEDQLSELLPTTEAGDREQLVALWRVIFPGMVASSWLVMTVLNGVLAQYLLVRSGKNLRPTPSFADLTLPKWLAFAAAAAAAVWLLGGESYAYIGQTLLIIFGFPFALQGLAVVHATSATLPMRGLVLFAFYVVFLISGWLVLVVAILGFLEPWTKIRSRLNQPRLGKEKE